MANFIGLEEAVKQYLDELAKTDKLFAKTYAKENKSVEKCCNYIVAEVQKMANGQQSIAVKDSDVYQLAVHYYDEDDIEAPAKVTGATVAASVSKSKADGVTEEKPKEKPKCKAAKTHKAEKPKQADEAKQVDEPKQVAEPTAKVSIEDYELDIPIF